MYGTHLTSQQWKEDVISLKAINSGPVSVDDSAYINWGLKGLSIQYEKISSKLKLSTDLWEAIS